METENAFIGLRITRQFVNALGDMGITRPTEIQQKAIPPLLAGQDVIGIAPTGTGKTLAFALPVVRKVNYHKEKGPEALVLVPTKELAIQCTDVFTRLVKYTDILVQSVVGGVGRTEQIRALEAGCDILVATPGRFKDLYYQGYIPMKHLKMLVLDEADRIMDMGFMPQLRDILEVVPVKRQNLLFSATFSEKVEELSHEFLDFPVKVEASESGKTVATVSQFKLLLKNRKSKLRVVEHLLQQQAFSRVLVFTRTKEIATQTGKFLGRMLGSDRIKVLHANKSQSARFNAYRAFNNGDLQCLVTTDVTSRGIDVAEVSHVIHLDAPATPETYIHRSGRTGRAEQVGISVLLYTPTERYLVEKVETAQDKVIPEWALEIPLPDEDFLPGEEQELLREIDMQRQQDDPNYRGAFHQRKSQSKKKIYGPKKPGLKR